MMRFGGTITLNGLVVYIAYNLEKVLLGRFWGAEAVGIYGRAYQLVNIPTDNLNSAVGGVAFAALSRLQEEPQRLKSYFLKGYSLVLALTLPTTIVCALFANDLIFVLLGPKWKEAIPIFRLLAPTILAFAMINPFGWLLFAMGKVARSLKICAGHRPPRHCGVRYRAALWTQRCCSWLLGGDVVVDRSPYIVVCAGHGDLPQGYRPDPKPATAFRHRGCNPAPCSPIVLWTIVIPSASTRVGNFGFFHRISRYAFVRYGRERVLPGYR